MLLPTSRDDKDWAQDCLGLRPYCAEQQPAADALTELGSVVQLGESFQFISTLQATGGADHD